MSIDEEGLFNGLEMFKIASVLLHEMFGGLRISTLQAEMVGKSNSALHKPFVKVEGLFNGMETTSKMAVKS